MPKVKDICGFNVNADLLEVQDLTKIAALGNKWIRFDIGWDQIETSYGVYDFTNFYIVLSNIESAVLSAIAIFNGVIDIWEELNSIRTPACRASYSTFCRAVVEIYKYKTFLTC